MIPVTLIVHQQLEDGLASIQPSAPTAASNLSDIFYGWPDTVEGLAEVKRDCISWLPTLPPKQIVDGYSQLPVPVPSIAIVNDGISSSPQSIGDFMGTLSDPTRTGQVYGERSTINLSLVLTADSLYHLEAMHGFVRWTLLRNRALFAKCKLEENGITSASSYAPSELVPASQPALQMTIGWQASYPDLYVVEYPALQGVVVGGTGDGGGVWTGGDTNPPDVCLTTSLGVMRIG